MNTTICPHHVEVDRCPDCVGAENIKLRKAVAVLVMQHGGLLEISEEVIAEIPKDLSLMTYRDAVSGGYVLRTNYPKHGTSGQ